MVPSENDIGIYSFFQNHLEWTKVQFVESIYVFLATEYSGDYCLNLSQESWSESGESVEFIEKSDFDIWLVQWLHGEVSQLLLSHFGP